MNPRVAVIVPARNEENFIGKSLKALLDQQTRPSKIIVVNDGSTDRTAEIASDIGAEVVSMPDRGFNVQGMPVLAGVINLGLAQLENDYCTESDYVMILGADHILPPKYITEVLNEMSHDRNLVLCSGIIEGERSVVPRGSGRIVRADFWKSIGFRYPENYGFETYLVLKAQQQGYDVKIFRNLVTTTMRKTGKNYKKSVYISYGKSLKALGYSRLYSLARIGLISLRNPRGGLYMIKGYRSEDVQTYDTELRTFLSTIQHKRIKRYITNPVKALTEAV